MEDERGIASDRFTTMVQVGGSAQYYGFLVNMTYEKNGTVTFEARKEPDTQTPEPVYFSDKSIEVVFDKVDAYNKRMLEKARIKVGVDVMVKHKDIWKPGKVTTLSHDGKARVKLEKGQIDVPTATDGFVGRICIASEENKKMLERLIEHEDLIHEAEKEIDKIIPAMTWFDSTPFIEVRRQEDEKAAREASAERAAREIAIEAARAKAPKFQRGK